MDEVYGILWPGMWQSFRDGTSVLYDDCTAGQAGAIFSSCRNVGDCAWP